MIDSPLHLPPVSGFFFFLSSPANVVEELSLHVILPTLSLHHFQSPTPFQFPSLLPAPDFHDPLSGFPPAASISAILLTPRGSVLAHFPLAHSGSRSQHTYPHSFKFQQRANNSQLSLLYPIANSTSAF